MIPTLKKRLYDRLKDSRIDMDNVVSVVCVILAISVIAVPAVAQTVNQTDDFENGNIDGWEGENMQVSGDSVEGDYSLFAQNGVSSQEENPEWVDGPTIDLNEEFTVTSTSRISQSGGSRAGFGIVRPLEGAGGTGGVILVFSDEHFATFIAETNSEDPATDNLETLSGHYNNQWVEWELYSDGTGTVQAKVWEYGTSEPTSYQISRDMELDSGQFSIFVGTGAATRNVNLDSVTINGTQQVDQSESLRLETGNYLPHGETQEYSVYQLEGEREIRNDVTDSANVTSGNTSVITVNQNTNELTATTDENVSTRVNITATYNGETTIEQVTVASPNIENLDVLPFMWRIGAMFLDRGFQMILTSLLLSIAATRVGGVYAGLGVYQMGLTAGWLIGWVPIGLAFVGLFSTLFIGLNIAANIDYSVRR